MAPSVVADPTAAAKIRAATANRVVAAERGMSRLDHMYFEGMLLAAKTERTHPDGTPDDGGRERWLPGQDSNLRPGD